MVSGQLMALCPSHPDRNPSLAVKEADNGNVLITCHGGCDSRDVVAALGLEMSDLFAEEATKDNKVVVARYPYIDGSTGEVLWEKIRYYPKTFAQIHYDRVGKEVWGLPKDVQPWLYRAPHFKKALDEGEPIWVCEGEADVHAVEAMGGYGTTQTMGAGKGKWKPFHTSLLRRASEVRIIVDLDEDKKNQRTGEDENIGRDYAFEVRDALTAEGIKVTMWRSPVGKDASDALHAGKKLEDFQKYRMPRQRVAGVMGHDLMVKEFPPLVFAVEGILPQGVAILGAPPKAAKSFLALDMAVGVATGGVCLSHLPCTLGDVLYIGLEDSERRLKDRIALLMENHLPDLSRIEFQSIDSEWQVGTQGRAWMEEWAEAAESPRLTRADHETDVVWQGYSIKGYIQDGSYYAEVDKLDGGASATWSLGAATGAMDDFEQNRSDDIEKYLTAKAFRIWYNHIDQCSTQPPTVENVRDVAADFMEGTYFIHKYSSTYGHVWASPDDGRLMFSTTSGATNPMAQLGTDRLKQFTLLGELQS